EHSLFLQDDFGSNIGVSGVPHRIRVALRDWDWLTPLVMGEVDLSPLNKLGYRVEIDRVSSLRGLQTAEEYDGGEVSLSRYLAAVAGEVSEMHALPHVLMQAFRHRCVLVSAASEATKPADLAGGKIGITGWQDSGNVWTRAALSDGGLRIPDAQWFAGRLTSEHPELDRLGTYGAPGRIEAIFGQPMVDRLIGGELDAILTPFMPQGFYSRESQLRPLFPDVRAAEKQWVAERGYVPGHHILAFKRYVPVEAQIVVSGLLEESKRQWQAKRQKLAETTAWTAVEFWDEAQSLPRNWDQQGLKNHELMFNEFVSESLNQGLIDKRVPIEELFPIDLPDAR